MKLNIVLIAIIGVLVFFLFFGHNGLLKYRELAGIKGKYETKIAELDKKVRILSDELRQAQKDKSYLEMMIKKDLNMQKPDEDVYILEPKEKSAPQKPDKSAAKKSK